MVDSVAIVAPTLLQIESELEGTEIKDPLRFVNVIERGLTLRAKLFGRCDEVVKAKHKLVATCNVLGCAAIKDGTPARLRDGLRVLAKADAHDGTVDHVVSECAVCGLAMPGSPDHALTVEGYEVHLCSDTCRDHMERHTAEVVANLDRLLD